MCDHHLGNMLGTFSQTPNKQIEVYQIHFFGNSEVCFLVELYSRGGECLSLSFWHAKRETGQFFGFSEMG